MEKPREFCKTESRGNIDMSDENIDTSNPEAATPGPADMEARHPLGGLLIPPDLDDLPVLSFSASKFVAPRTIYCMDYFLPAKDQGKKPWCAGYAASSFLENIVWRRDDVPLNVDPTWIYQWAKQHDGRPNEGGTSLTAVLNALLAHNCFNQGQSPVKVLRTVEQVKYALHKYGACLLGLNITREWYGCNKNKTAIYGQSGYNPALIGGHAVVSGGYDKDGIYILNSWGGDWGSHGRALLTWDQLARQFIYGAVPDNCLANVHINA